MDLKSKFFEGRITWCAVGAMVTTMIYSLAFASLYLPITGGDNSVFILGIEIIFLAMTATLVLAPIGGRKGGTGRTVGVLCGMTLIAIPAVAAIITSVRGYL